MALISARNSFVSNLLSWPGRRGQFQGLPLGLSHPYSSYFTDQRINMRFLPAAKCIKSDCILRV